MDRKSERNHQSKVRILEDSALLREGEQGWVPLCLGRYVCWQPCLLQGHCADSDFPAPSCCIDKTSSAELSEAINSMFKWYQGADICYAYLEDVPRGDDGQEPDISASRWFTRGWTLQELIAPQHMEFLAADWSSLGFKADLFDSISSSSHIQKEYLIQKKHFRTASIARRMSWVASRETTRIEDMAYCLLGIFDVNMPMIYGEGTKAFRRLQEEIIKLYPEDHSIYAWDMDHQPRDEFTDNMEANLRDHHGPATKPLLGLLAESPKQFSQSGDVVPVSWVGRFYRTWRNDAEPPISIGKTIKIDIPVIPAKLWSTYQWEISAEPQTRRAIDSVLLCTMSDSKRLIILPLVSWGGGYFGRLDRISTKYGIDMEKEDPSTLLNLHQVLHVATEETIIQPAPYDIVIRELEVLERGSLSLWGSVINHEFSLERENVVRVGHRQEGVFLAYNFTYGHPVKQGFSVVLARKSRENNKLPLCYIYFCLWYPPFRGSAWTSNIVENCHFLNLENKFETIPSPFPSVKVSARLERIKELRLDEANAVDQESFIDVIDLHVKECFRPADVGRRKVTNVTGTIQKTWERVVLPEDTADETAEEIAEQNAEPKRRWKFWLPSKSKER